MGKVIVIEGLDGSGKKTQMKKLKDRLISESYNIQTVDFPRYDNDSSIFVRRYLGGVYGSDPSSLSPYEGSMCYAMDRFDTFKNNDEIKKVLESERAFVLADRYTTSNMLFQGTKIDSDEDVPTFLEWAADLEYNKLGIPKPDLVLLLYMPASYSINLIKQRDVEQNAEKNNMTTDIHENNNQFLVEVAKRALLIAKLQNFKVINCVKNGKLRTIEDIHEEIYSIVTSL